MSRAISDNEIMRKISNQILAQLLMDTRFAPKVKQLKQLDSAEKLYLIIAPDTDYTFEFVCFHITGYRPKGPVGTELIKGKELIESIPDFIARLSSRLAIKTTDQKEPVYSIETLAEHFKVSTKTINRWRKRGLIGRSFVFEDNLKRLGFSQSTIDVFTAKNSDLIGKAGNFTQLGDDEKSRIIESARKLAQDGRLSCRSVINKIATQYVRAAETIRYTLADYEKQHRKRPIFKKSRSAVTPKDAGIIYSLYKTGTEIDELMHRYGRSKSSIYRIINQRRVRELFAHKIDFIASDEFLTEDAETKILADTPDILKSLQPEKTSAAEKFIDVRPQYIEAIKMTQLLNRQQEVELFRRYNFLKYLASARRKEINQTRPVSKLIGEVEKYLAEAEKIKNVIIESNLRLVVGVAGRHVQEATMHDLISEGNLSLMRAVEKFDYTRGFRFGTYASWAIAKDFARKIPAEAARPDKAAGAYLEYVQHDMRNIDAVDIEAIEGAHHSLEEVIKDNLTEREQYIIRYHFGLVGTTVKKESKSLRQIGEKLNLSKERIRQIELGALQKLRQCLSAEEFELLTG